MNHLFLVTHQDKSKLVTVEGTHEYAISYISGYVQALRDKFGKLGKIRVQKAPLDVVNNGKN
tara:strand:- start:1062 stop:1247 length:186 start_codon:yes stop_codon:yes gene_type:complete